MTLSEARPLVVLAVAVALGAGGSVATTGAVLSTSASPSLSGEFDGGGGDVGVQDVTEIEECTTIDQPGTYVLTSDVENGGKTAISKACIEITADGVTFDGGDHRIDGRGVSHTKGIAVVGAEDVTVRDVAVNDWHSGVLVENGSATVENVRTFSNAYGVRLEDATGATVTNSTIENNLVGVRTGTTDPELSDNEFSGNEIRIQNDG